MKDYHSSHAIRVERPQTEGFAVLPVLPFLYGHKWDQVALNFVHSLNPLYIRVTTGEVKTDSMLSRVTVYVGAGDVITHIEQEVAVGLDGIKVAWGSESLMQEARKRGITIK